MMKNMPVMSIMTRKAPLGLIGVHKLKLILSFFKNCLKLMLSLLLPKPLKVTFHGDVIMDVDVVLLKGGAGVPILKNGEIGDFAVHGFLLHQRCRRG